MGKRSDLRKATRRSSSTGKLDKLAASDRRKVRRAVASNPRAAEDTLARLAMDDDLGVRKRVAENPTTPTDTLRQLADTTGPDNGDIAAAVAANPSTPEDLLIAFSRSDDLEIRSAAASNPAMPAWRLRELSEPTDINQLTWLGLIRNPNAPRDWVVNQGHQEYYQVVEDGPALRHPKQDPDLVLYAAGMETLLIQRAMLIDAFADTALDKHALMTDVDAFFAWCGVVSKRRHGNV